MTQSEILNHFAEKTGLKRVQVKEFFDQLPNWRATKSRTTVSLLCRVLANWCSQNVKHARGAIPRRARRFKFPPKRLLSSVSAKG
jgi:hypothetical protein